MTVRVSIESDAGVAVVVVDNPPVNALSNATIAALGDAADRLAADAHVRAIVLTGAGERAFVSGADLREFSSALGDDSWIEDHTSRTRRALTAWERVPQPVVAAVGASALGGGLEVALVCDLILADCRARFGLPEVRLGLIPGAGGTQRLPRRIGAGRAKEMLLLGETIDAEEAQRAGLVNRVTPAGQARDEACELAAKLASLPALAVQAIKRSVDGARSQELSRGLDLERELFMQVFASTDAREGVRAFLEKRRPTFQHR